MHYFYTCSMFYALACFVCQQQIAQDLCDPAPTHRAMLPICCRSLLPIHCHSSCWSTALIWMLLGCVMVLVHQHPPAWGWLLWSSSHFGANFVSGVLLGESVESIESSLDSTDSSRQKRGLALNKNSQFSQSPIPIPIPISTTQIQERIGIRIGPSSFQEIVLGAIPIPIIVKIHDTLVSMQRSWQ